jgi:hypothetical protein
LSSGLPDDDPKVYLLEDIRDVFDGLDIDRISSAALLGGYAVHCGDHC